MPATLLVTRTDDVVTEYGTLRWAVANAQNGDTILLTNAVKNTGITLTQGELVLGQDVTIESKGKTPVTISGGGISRIFEVAPGAQVTLSNLIITGGNGLANNPAGDAENDGGGGGILVDAGSALTVSGSTLSGNSAYVGGGIINFGTLTVSGSTLSGNSASYQGGGIFNWFGFEGATLTVSGSTLSDNAATSGGGIFTLGPVAVSESNLSGNSADFFGGGISSYGTVTVSGSTLSGNSAGSAGGGISNHYGSTLTVSDSTLSDNNSAGQGGAISIEDGTLTVRDCTLSDNSAVGRGGSIFNFGELTISGTTLSGNSASYGGGIFNEQTLAISGSTLSGNTAIYGGGIFNNGMLAVSGSTLSGNSAGFGGAIMNYGTVTLSGSTLSGNSATEAGGGIYNLSYGGDSPPGTVTVRDSSRLCDNIAPAGFGADVYNLGVLYQDITSTICDLFGPRVWI